MHDSKVIQVGFGAADITADWPVGLQGLGTEATRISTEIASRIYIYCVAITDSRNETVLIMTIDAGYGGFHEIIFPPIEREFGIPRDHMLLSALHQHSTPYGGERYEALLASAGVAAVRQALSDRAPATMYTNKVETRALSFVRNYIANDPAGSIVGDNYNDPIGREYGYKCHESDSDKEMRLIKFVREGGRKPIILVNFQAHPHLGAFGANLTVQHADWPGIMRDQVADALNAHCVYISGAGGNLNSNSRIAEENLSTDWRHHGQRAADYVISAEESYRQVDGGNIKIRVATIGYPVDHSMDHLLDAANVINDLSLRDFGKARAQTQKYPEFSSIYHAQTVVEKAALPENYDLTIGAFAIGDVAFTLHPYEMFDTNGMELRGGTVGNPNYRADQQLENPFEMTFICTLSNGHMGYVPSLMSYRNGGYSTDIAYLIPGSGERLVRDYLAILNDLHSI